MWILPTNNSTKARTHTCKYAEGAHVTSSDENVTKPVCQRALTLLLMNEQV